MGCIWDKPATRKAPEPVSRLVLAHRNIARRWEARAMREPSVLWTSPRPEGLYLAGETILEPKSYNPPHPTRCFPEYDIPESLPTFLKINFPILLLHCIIPR